MYEPKSDEQAELAKLVMALLDSWGLSTEQKINILAMPNLPKVRSMRQYYKGRAFPDDPAIMERIDHIVGIADALRTSYPLNEYMPAFWLQKPNKRFGDRAPLNCMLEDGIDGIVAVRVHLDCAYDWDISTKFLD